jgi:hypothetical protein
VRARLALAAGLAGLALACTRAREPAGPVPLAVNPSRATAAAPVRVEIAGRDFDANVKADFSSGGASLDAAFAVRLEPSDVGSTAPLAEVALTERRTLRATVPAGLAAGTYRLVVTDPAGRSGRLERAYRVVSSASAVARFEVAPGATPRAGVPFPVTVTAVDAGGGVVDGFTGTVTLSDGAGLIAPRVHGPFVLGRATGRVRIAAAVASDTLAVSDGAGHGGTSAPFAVVAGPPMALVFAGAPVVARAGVCSPAVALALRDGTGAATVAETAVAVDLQSSPPGLATFSDAGCTSPAAALTLAPGAGGASFWFRAAAAGAPAIRAVAATLPSVVQAEVVTP